MDELLLFSICTPHRQAHKWEINAEGLVDFFGNMITPHEAFERFLVEYPMFKVIRADITKRLDVPNGEYAYTWIDVERLF